MRREAFALLGFAALALLILLVAWLSDSPGATLTCTAPTGGQRWMKIFDPDVNDSVWSVECSGGPAIHDSLWVVLWEQPLTGGGFTPSDSQRVAPGDSVRFTVGPGHYFAIARNGVGPSCGAQDAVYVPPTDVTLVPLPERPHRPGKPDIIRWFDVRGRLVDPVASGVYFWKAWYRGGRVESGDTVIVK